MPIREDNIVFVKHQVMDDVPEGGGAATGNVVQDGQMNNVFEDISDLDRAVGRFSMRKLSVAVRTLSTDLLSGARTLITALPTDPAVGYALFTTPDPYDVREQAANLMAAYLYKGPLWEGYLYTDHIAGMPSLTLIQKVDSVLPPIGKTLCLIANEGEANEVEEYVRVIDLSVVETTWVDGSNDKGDDLTFTRWVVTCTLLSGLKNSFAGHEATRLDSGYTYTGGRARVRDTRVVEAMRFYGSQALVEDAQIGDLAIRAASQFTQLVPTAQTETPHANAVLNAGVSATYDNGSRPVEVIQQAHTWSRTVTPENRALVHVITLVPIPAPGTLSWSYMAQGNWYVLADDGDGNVTGLDPSAGAGVLDYTTGALRISLGALPDVDSALMAVWGSPVHYEVRAGASADADTALTLRGQLAQAPVVPGTLTLTWYVGGAARSLTDTDSNGTLAGGGVAGTIDYASGSYVLRFTAAPDSDRNLLASYTWREGADLYSGTNATLNGNTFAVPGIAPFRAGGTFTALLEGTTSTASAYITVDGEVRVRQEGHARSSNSWLMWVDQPIGTFDPQTGVVTLTNPVQYRYSAWGTNTLSWDKSAVGYYSISGVTNIQIERDTSAYDAQSATNEAHSPLAAGLSFDLTSTVSDTVVPNSVAFTLAGQAYEDRNAALYTDIDPATGSGLVAGNIDYGTGLVTLTRWPAGAGAPNITACLTQYGEFTAVEAEFRTASAPLKPESLQILAITEDGEQITGIADADGNIIGDTMRGTVNYQYGIVRVEFGALSGQDWTPRPVLPSASRYNAVSYSYIPLDSTILGIDAVRLPTDGRVPIYRKGDVIMVLHSADHGPITPALVTEAGETWYQIDLPRTRIGWVRVTDANGAQVANYRLNRAAGAVRFDSLDGLALPLTVRHTVSDMRIAADVQIGGQITLSRPLSHEFPAGETVVASCLLHGDRRARVSATWDQQTWNGTWSDSPVGNEATATLNLIDYPITVTNEGCDTDQWMLRCINASTAQWELISRNRGLVWSGTYAPGGTDIAPINPRTRGADGQGGTPYMVIPGAANGGGWANGNIVRINTVGAIAHIWLSRSVQQSDPPMDDGVDSAEIHCIANIDNPIQ